MGRFSEKLADVLAYPLVLLYHCVCEITGDRRWYRRQYRKMVSERPALTDEQFLKAVDARPNDKAVWLAVREATAQSIGVPAVFVYPEDPLADLWRMQLVGPDILDIRFRMERILSRKLPSSELQAITGGAHYGQQGRFRDFAAQVVEALCDAKQP